MSVLVAFVLGYILGVKTDNRDLEPLRRSVVALYGTDEFADVVTAARKQSAGLLRTLAGMVDDDGIASRTDADLVSTVRHLVGRD